MANNYLKTAASYMYQAATAVKFEADQTRHEIDSLKKQLADSSVKMEQDMKLADIEEQSYKHNGHIDHAVAKHTQKEHIKNQLDKLKVEMQNQISRLEQLVNQQLREYQSLQQQADSIRARGG